MLCRVLEIFSLRRKNEGKVLWKLVNVLFFFLIPLLNVCSKYFCSGLKTFLNLSPTVVLTD